MVVEAAVAAVEEACPRGTAAVQRALAELVEGSDARDALARGDVTSSTCFGLRRHFRGVITGAR